MIQSKRLTACPPLLAVTSSAPLARGSNGPAVAALQDLLDDLGYDLPRSHAKGGWDGIFGAETEAAVRAFQARNGLAADGMVGPRTLAALDHLILGNPLLELIDYAKYKSDQMLDRMLPAERRGNAYW